MQSKGNEIDLSWKNSINSHNDKIKNKNMYVYSPHDTQAVILPSTQLINVQPIIWEKVTKVSITQ